jgi:hypothetical protein
VGWQVGRLVGWKVVGRMHSRSGAAAVRTSGNRSLAAMILTTLVVLTGCGFSPEQAALRALMEGSPTTQINPATIQALQSQSWGETVNVLVAFQAIEENGQVFQCLFLYEAHKSRQLGWGVSHSGGGCGPLGGSGEPIGIGGGQHSGTGRPAISHATGLVFQPDIASIEIVWDDGERQRVEVVNNSYLALRTGRHEYAQIQALNGKDEVIYTYENPPPAPGKESHQRPNPPANQFTNLREYSVIQCRLQAPDFYPPRFASPLQGGKRSVLPQ